MQPPWVSGISQGHGLAFFTRLTEETDSPYYRAILDSVFQAFTFTDTECDYWITTIDSSGYYWIEEYPFFPKTSVLNGFLYAINGLYEYYQLTHSQAARNIFEGACTTLKHNLELYRVPGGISRYCLGHPAYLGSYHLLVTRQIRYLYLMTSEQYFSDFADSLESDYSLLTQSSPR